MLLYIVRHAWAGDPQASNDDLRPLTDDGRKRFARMARRMVEAGVAPRLIATSPLVRCVETAQILASEIADSQIVKLNSLCPGGDWDALLHWTAGHAADHDQIAWVGHVPDVNHLTAALIGQGASSIHFAKGAVAAIEFEDRPAFAQGELRWLVTAKLLGA
jgi:phosphohistidine phosphatase